MVNQCSLEKPVDNSNINLWPSDNRRIKSIANLAFVVIFCITLFGCHEQAGPGLFEASVLYGNADAGILRTDPTTYGFEIGIVKKGEAVKVIDRTDHKVRIGKSNDYWYFVRKENNLKGWIYGTALSRISTGEAEEIVEGPDMVVVQANLPGIWWEQNQDGSTGYRRIEFIPEGTEEKPTAKKGEHSEQAEALKAEEAPTEVILTDKGKFQYFYGKTPGAVLKYTIDVKTRKIILAQESPIGRELEFIDVGEEYRMTSAKGDKKFSFKKGYKTEEVDG